jgi:hypothetical protein
MTEQAPDAAGATSTAPRVVRRLVVLVVALAALFVVVLFFLLGRNLSWFDESTSSGSTSAPGPTGGSTPTPSPSASPTPAPTPTHAPAAAAPAGPAAVGVHPWTELAGGECLDPYSSPWEETFTVVDCAAPHAAQLIERASINADPAAAYPGEAAITAQLNLACTAPTALDLAAASAFTAIQWQASYPVTAEQWAAGQRDYFCFISRSSGEPLTGSVAAVG